MAVDPTIGIKMKRKERANQDIYDDFKLKNPCCLHGLYNMYKGCKGQAKYNTTSTE